MPKRDGDYRPWIDIDTWLAIVRSGLEMSEERVEEVCDMFGQQNLDEGDEMGEKRVEEVCDMLGQQSLGEDDEMCESEG
ncbi:hypothetical protein GMOD_00001482 [Pyrenophora seminiperda CCB06]|uniref:Uncharacterized protein n=1 Tax=Pyrenophora seminiperda CCB06 TaxID=1302712 RepID=A0A3M7LZ55_9PLEO|nr:hypothetical protein GMOD_00001482 [Pyrenophora seminiperda CCB06]